MTLYLIAERILRLYSGGDISDDTGIKIEDVKHLVVDQINQMLKTETISLNEQLGDGAPSNLMIATYPAIPVSVYKTSQSRATLPAVPVSLPLNLGVWWVSPDADANNQDQFVPLQSSQWALIKDYQPLVNNGKILGNYTYEVEGKYIIFPTDISSAVPNVMIKLIISDVSTLGDYDLLPVPSDYVADIINNVMAILSGVQPGDSANDANPQR